MATIKSINLTIQAERVDRTVAMWPGGYGLVSGFKSSGEGVEEELAVVNRIIAAASLAAGWTFRRSIIEGLRPDGAEAAYYAICAVIDRVKTDDRHLDTDEYAGMIVEALGGVHPEPEYDGERACAACGDYVQTLSTDDLCDGCVADGIEICRAVDGEGCGEYREPFELNNTTIGRICDSCIHNINRSGGQVVYL